MNIETTLPPIIRIRNYTKVCLDALQCAVFFLIKRIIALTRNSHSTWSAQPQKLYPQADNSEGIIMRTIRNAFTAVILLVSLNGAQAAETVVGKLDCDVSAGIGAIIGSQQEVACSFLPSAPGSSQKYFGKITHFGLDLGAIEKGRLIWLVYAPSVETEAAIQGTYRGASATATFGVGLGANVLVGGGHDSFALQPFSVEAQQGVNIAIGVSELSLRPL